MSPFFSTFALCCAHSKLKTMRSALLWVVGVCFSWKWSVPLGDNQDIALKISTGWYFWYPLASTCMKDTSPTPCICSLCEIPCCQALQGLVLAFIANFHGNVCMHLRKQLAAHWVSSLCNWLVYLINICVIGNVKHPCYDTYAQPISAIISNCNVGKQRVRQFGVFTIQENKPMRTRTEVKKQTGQQSALCAVLFCSCSIKSWMQRYISLVSCLFFLSATIFNSRNLKKKKKVS